MVQTIDTMWEKLVNPCMCLLYVFLIYGMINCCFLKLFLEGQHVWKNKVHNSVIDIEILNVHNLSQRNYKNSQSFSADVLHMAGVINLHHDPEIIVISWNKRIN